MAQGLHPQQMTVAIAKSIKAKSLDRDRSCRSRSLRRKRIPDTEIRTEILLCLAVQTNILVAKRAFLTPWHLVMVVMAWTRGLCRRLLLECGAVPSWYGTERLKAYSMPKKHPKSFRKAQEIQKGRVLVPYFSIFSWCIRLTYTDTS